jgi:hypothetical protein
MPASTAWVPLSSSGQVIPRLSLALAIRVELRARSLPRYD